MTLRGLQNQNPSVPFSSVLVNPPPASSSTSSTSHQPSSPPQDTHIPDFQNSVELLQIQNEELHQSMEALQQQVSQQLSFQNQLSAQFSALQNTVLASLLQKNPPTSTNPTTTPSTTTTPATTPTTPNPTSIPFGSFDPMTTTWTGLGLSHPPPLSFAPLPQSPYSQAQSSQSSTNTTSLSSSTATYSTITSLPPHMFSPPLPNFGSSTSGSSGNNTLSFTRFPQQTQFHHDF
ncbi:uncharacterized serine-rich protein C215.13-like [Rosa rugosa]|uniref:uncharacterized serine-rich protein C215.13-like n=1 Tax=Rosa rugosa TaxID=74645 RepID=UPI002B417AA2|nr:uncharacterized serine-rich protein C215.13-like [Rosa rugosa]